jgi:hypothetical protein
MTTLPFFLKKILIILITSTDDEIKRGQIKNFFRGLHLSTAVVR